MYWSCAVAVLLMMSSSCLIAQDTKPLSQNDVRFRPLQPGVTKPSALPPGTKLDELMFFEHVLGADDAPPLKIAIHEDEQRIWLDSQRDGKWFLARSLRDSGRTHWVSQVLAQSNSSKGALWPSPEAISITLQRDRTGVWMLATNVQVVGELDLNGRKLAYELRDENSDGKLDGIDDSLRIDANGDGTIDPLREVHPLARLFRLQGGRFALKMDREKKQVGLQSIDATGLVQLTFDGWTGLEQIPTRMVVVLQSDTGIQVVCESIEPQVAPVGRYHIYSASLLWDGNEKWRMVFARAGNVPRTYHVVVEDQTASVSVLGKTELSAEIDSPKYADNKWQMTLLPAIVTESGLYMTRASFGREYASTDGRLIANVGAARDDKNLTTGSTQFACGSFCPIHLSWKGESASQVTLSFDTGPMAGLMTKKIAVEKK